MSQTRTVVKANYVQGRGAKGAARAHNHANAAAAYYANRPDEDGKRQEREGFTATESGLDLDEIKDELDEAEGAYMYRMVLSPGEDLDGDDLEEWTRDVMEDFDGDWVAFAHEDQTDHSHVHVIAFTDEKFDSGDFLDMREAGDESYQQFLEELQELKAEAEIEPEYAEMGPGYEPEEEELSGLQAAYDEWNRDALEEEARLNNPDYIDPSERDMPDEWNARDEAYVAEREEQFRQKFEEPNIEME